jgi:uncharacterized protein (TIGR00725 family)
VAVRHVIQVAVCGPARCSAADDRHAYRIGELLAEAGAVTLCGGGTGVMAAVAAGARGRDGLVVGIRPDSERSSGVSVTVATNLGQARNVVLVTSADAVIAVGGSWGTLSEVAHAMRRGGIPVVSLGGWRIVDAAGVPVPGIRYVETPEEAVALALAASSDSSS